MLNKEKQKQR